jgi:protocatechuate 3,4-dioxygenase beta subunit
MTSERLMTHHYRGFDGAAHPPYDCPLYGSTARRAPQHPPVRVPQGLSELTAPIYGQSAIRPGDTDLTTNAGTGGTALGQRILVGGRVLDEHGRAVPNTLLEVWQCNAAGRYHHARDDQDVPLDPHFIGAGRVLTDDSGGYQFTTIKPGAYPWRNSANAWRPAHIHFSLFGPAFVTRLVTQMYFEADPLLPLDAIYMSVPEGARERLVAHYDHDTTRPHFALSYRFDIVLRGRTETPFEGS